MTDLITAHYLAIVVALAGWSLIFLIFGKAYMIYHKYNKNNDKVPEMIGKMLYREECYLRENERGVC